MRNYLSTTLYYDANGSAAGVGGSGVWDHTSALWNTAADGSGNRVAWDGVSGVKSAVFGGVFGQVAIQSDVVVDSLSIQTPGYKIIGDHTLMFGSTGSITTAAGVDLRLSTKLSGSITISGDGVNAIILTRDVGRDNTNPSITVANGSLLRLSATQHLNALTLDAGAAARINQGGAKALVLNTLHIAGTLTTPTATLDVEDNAMIVTDANAAAQVFGWMVAGFGTGDWTGHGITSTIAANDPNGLLALGYANNIDLGASQFAGITLGNNDTIVKFTYYGDADLDGVVTLEDFSQFLYGYQQGGTPNWIDGDFDYSGTVTLEDFSLFLANHNTTPATPTYAIDGLDQTFTAGEEVTLSPRITNNIPLPAGTVFSWTVKQGNTTIATSNAADFAFTPPTQGTYNIALTKTDASGTSTVATSVADVDTPAGWTVIYGFSNPDSEPTRWPGVVGDLDDHEWKHGPGKYTLLLNNLPKHSWLTGVPAIAADIQLSHPVLNSWPADSKLTIKYGEYTRTVHLYTGAVDGDLPEFMPHTANSITYSVELSGVDNSVNWFIGNTAVETFLPTVNVIAQGTANEGQSKAIGDADKLGFWVQRTGEGDLLSQSIKVPLIYGGNAEIGSDVWGVPDFVKIPSGESQVFVPIGITEDVIPEWTELFQVKVLDSANYTTIKGQSDYASFKIYDDDYFYLGTYEAPDATLPVTVSELSGGTITSTHTEEIPLDTVGTELNVVAGVADEDWLPWLTGTETSSGDLVNQFFDGLVDAQSTSGDAGYPSPPNSNSMIGYQGDNQSDNPTFAPQAQPPANNQTDVVDPLVHARNLTLLEDIKPGFNFEVSPDGQHYLGTDSEGRITQFDINLTEIAYKGTHHGFFLKFNDDGSIDRWGGEFVENPKLIERVRKPDAVLNKEINLLKDKYFADYNAQTEEQKIMREQFSSMCDLLAASLQAAMSVAPGATTIDIETAVTGHDPYHPSVQVSGASRTMSVAAGVLPIMGAISKGTKALSAGEKLRENWSAGRKFEQTVIAALNDIEGTETFIKNTTKLDAIALRSGKMYRTIPDIFSMSKNYLMEIKHVSGLDSLTPQLEAQILSAKQMNMKYRIILRSDATAESVARPIKAKILLELADKGTIVKYNPITRKLEHIWP